MNVSNTTAELVQHDERLRAAALNLLGHFGLIVVGYSGRDPAVMRMLFDVLEQPTRFPTGLTWVRRPEDVLSEDTHKLLDAARNAGVEPVHEIEASGMMELMAELERTVQLPPRIRIHLDAHRPAPLREPASLPTGRTGGFPQVRLAALPLLSLPTRARLLDGPPDLPLSPLRQALRANRARAVIARRTGGQLVAFGNDAMIATAFAEHGVRVTTSEAPLDSPGCVAEPDGIDLGLMAKALARALGRTRGITEVLRTGQRHLLRARDHDPNRREDDAALHGLRKVVGPVTGQLPGPAGASLPWAEAVALAVDWRDGRWRLLFAPEIWVRPDFTELPAGMNRQEARVAAAQLAAEVHPGPPCFPLQPDHRRPAWCVATAAGSRQRRYPDGPHVRPNPRHRPSAAPHKFLSGFR